MNRKIIIIICLIIPSTLFSQIAIKGGISIANRWDETLNSQTLGKGFRLSAEKQIVSRFSIGVAISSIAFKPNELLDIKYKTLDLLATYYFSNNTLQPYVGIGFGYTQYADKSTLDIGNGITTKQTRDKNYGNISPFFGLKYSIGKEKKLAIFMQSNADFVPVVNIVPIGYLSLTSGLFIKF